MSPAEEGMPRIHPRHFIVAKARHGITEAIIKANAEYHLTYAELNLILADELRAWNGYAVRDEREAPE
jgi:hypothetical protein